MNKLVYKNVHFKTTSVDETNHTIRGIFSTADEDRHGEIVNQDGWKLEEFMKNPVVLFAHDHYQPAIGKIIELGKNTVGDLEGMIQFAYEEYEFAATIFKLYAGGYMRAFSVGFMNDVIEYDQTEDKVTLVENTLYEISCVNVPANAMALAYSKGIDMTPIENYLKKSAEKIQEKKVEKKEESPIEIISKSNKETIRSAIKALTEALNAGSETDNKVGQEVEHPEKSGGTKKIPVTIINKAIRELLAIKKTQ